MILKIFKPIFLFFGGCFLVMSPLYSQTDTAIQVESIDMDTLMPTEAVAVPLDEMIPEEAPIEEPIGTWTFYGNSNISTNQSQFSNWQGGGQNSIAISTSLNLNLTYQSPNLTWETTFDAGYGLILQGTNGRWFKNDDTVRGAF